MKLVGYLRVSTDTQAEKGMGLGVQEAAIRSWARKKGHRVVAVCTDAGISGANGLDGRDGLAEVVSMLRDGQARGLVVYRLDRLARDLVLQEQLLADLWRIGADVFSTASGEADLRDDPDDPSRRMIRQILGAVSEYERGMIALRLRRGREAKAAGGGFAFGAPPYGWRSEAGELVPIAEEQDVMRRIRGLHTSGQSLRAIARLLNGDAVPTRRDGGRWHPQTVARIIQRH